MKGKLALNTVSSIAYQLVTVVCGFILPVLFIRIYGSEVNGLVSSITKFLSMITFLELGIGAVIQSALYKPLYEHNYDKLNEIITSGKKYFNFILITLSVYVLILFFVYPLTIDASFGFFYTALLIAAISISSFGQYAFGMIDKILLNADQRGYIVFISQIIATILNTLICYFVIKEGASVHLVKLLSSLIFFIRPIVIHQYVKRKYRLKSNIKLKSEPIKQKWNGIAQHISFVIMEDTDVLCLTYFSTLQNVSIYTVYNSVVYGVKSILASAMAGVQSYMGYLVAKDNKEELLNFFGMTEWLTHMVSTLLFTITGILIIPFISVYTAGMDINYIYPFFAYVITVANGIHCVREPYKLLTQAAGHFKETQMCYVWAAFINIITTIPLIHYFGLVGAAIGTLIAFSFQTIWLAAYISKTIINWPFKNFVKQVISDVALCVAICIATRWINFSCTSYFGWILLACKVAIIAFVITLLVSLLLNRRFLMYFIRYFITGRKKRN